MNRFAFQLQGLSTATDRVLIVADLVGSRSEDTRFTPADLRDVFYALNVPPPSNISYCLKALADRQQAFRHPDGRWALTPKGTKAVEQLAVDPAPTVAAAMASRDGAEFAHVDHTIIPTWAAPPRWSVGIARLLDRHPFDTNVFCMTRFPSEGSIPDPVKGAIEAARGTLKNFGLTLHLATDGAVDDDLLGNVGAYMWGCRYGLGFIEDRIGRGLNYNTVIELGGMSITGRRCGVLKDRTVPSLPTDLSGHIYKSVDFDDLTSVSEATSAWASSDLGLTAS